MSFVQLIYRSARIQTDDIQTGKSQDQVLDGIMETATRLNRRNGITGCLGYSNEWYVQVLEGNRAAIDETIARICRDQRHSDVKTLLVRDIRNRSFPEWSMLSVPLGQDSVALRGGSPISPVTTPPLQLMMWLMNLADSVRMNRPLNRLY